MAGNISSQGGQILLDPLGRIQLDLVKGRPNLDQCKNIQRNLKRNMDLDSYKKMFMGFIIIYERRKMVVKAMKSGSKLGNIKLVIVFEGKDN